MQDTRRNPNTDPYMKNWGYAVDNPYYAVTDETGSFPIEDLPPGTYRLKAWHPILGTY